MAVNATALNIKLPENSLDPDTFKDGVVIADAETVPLAVMSFATDRLCVNETSLPLIDIGKAEPVPSKRLPLPI